MLRENNNNKNDLKIRISCHLGNLAKLGTIQLESILAFFDELLRKVVRKQRQLLRRQMRDVAVLRACVRAYGVDAYQCSYRG